MELYILGSGTCVPTAERGPSGLALAFNSHLIFFDGGGGSLRQMARLNHDFRQIDYFCITHFHPDHVSDLVPFLFALNYTIDYTHTRPLHLIGPPGLKKFYDQLRGIFGSWIEPHTYDLFLHEGEAQALSFSDFTLTSLPMKHSAIAIGFRIDQGGRSLVYSGDTDYCANIIELGREANLLILECSFPDHRRKSGHLTPTLAGQIAREAACQRLLLTHFYPVFQGQNILAECRQEFSGEIILAADGMKIVI
jgi:ribonuclease BN (tRNA processing enzyme)